MIIGNTYLNDDDDLIKQKTNWGFIGPRHEWFTLDGVSFYNFDFSDSAAIGTCSHCFHPASTDSGGRTMSVKNLVFDDATVPKRIFYQEPWREIILDLDGSLTNLGPNTWATFSYPHLLHPECTEDLDVFDGVICDSSIALRRIAFWDYEPQSLTMNKFKIARWETEFEEELKANLTAVLDAGGFKNQSSLWEHQ